jgi:ubiquinone/menaquinone biosynthesis C-methylase UbiE
MLYFAPSKTFDSFIKKTFTNINYRSADLSREDVDDNIDITDMKIYENESFDFIICSHILEHVEEDEKALLELHRVLTKNGKAIIMVPIMLSLKKDFVNQDVVSEIDRWKYYGQNDHVRMYSKPGFLKKLKSAGFKVNPMDYNFLGLETFAIHGIHKRSVLYIVQK